MSDFGELREACHRRDLRALIEAAYRKRRYVLHEPHERYIRDVLPEYEHEVWVWARAMVDHLLEHTNVPHVMTRAFAATWAEWMCAGAVGYMPIRLWANNTDVVLYKMARSGADKWVPNHHVYIVGHNAIRANQDKNWRAVWLNEYVYRQ